jgi:hypothetical protein
MQGDYRRHEIVTRRVEYVIDTEQPVEAKTLGIVLANVHRELGARVQSDAAYEVEGRDGQVVITFAQEKRDSPCLWTGDMVAVRMPNGMVFAGQVVSELGDDELLIIPQEDKAPG